VVDDNQTNLSILKNQLLQWKLNPVLALSPNEAFGILRDKTIDLIITDMQMPEMDGLQFVHKVKEQYDGIPVILLSSIGDESKKRHGDLFVAVLNKPVKQNQLYNQIHQHLSGSSVPLRGTEFRKPSALPSDFATRFPLKILLAEDNPVNQKLAGAVLKKLGYAGIVIAENGTKTIEKTVRENFDVVLMDIQMPEMDGLEATKIIRSSNIKQPVIIAMTANSMPEDREICLSAGMNDYISKPIKFEELMKALEKAAEMIP
jgi:CheY-like chemotaxis protein